MTQINMTHHSEQTTSRDIPQSNSMPSTADLSYNSFFGFEETPFSISPNPRFLYMSVQHQEALAHLLYGVSASNGFVLLTGEVGTGKTTVIRAFLQHLPEDARVAYILHAKLTAQELLETIIEELNIDLSEDNSQRAMIAAIHQKLLENFAAGFRTFLLIDEAQNLSVDVLEEIRLLTNLETDEGKLLHIILVGQPELRTMFQAQDLRQLNQRITARYHLNQLSDEDVIFYIQHRLAVARAPRNPMTTKAMKALAKYSRGVPRLLNILSDRALLAAFARHQIEVDHVLVKEAACEVFDDRSFGGRLWKNWKTSFSNLIGFNASTSATVESHLGLGTKFILVVLTIGIVGLLTVPLWQITTDEIVSYSAVVNVDEEGLERDLTESASVSMQGMSVDNMQSQTELPAVVSDQSQVNASAADFIMHDIEESAKELEQQQNLKDGLKDGLVEERVESDTNIEPDTNIDTGDRVQLQEIMPASTVALESTRFEEALILDLKIRGISVPPSLTAAINTNACDALPNQLGCLLVESSLKQLVELDTPFLFQLAPGQLRSLGIEFEPDASQGLTRFTWFLAHAVNSSMKQVTISAQNWSRQIDIVDLSRVFLGRAHLVMQTPVETMPENKPLSVEHARWIIGHIGFSDGETLDPVFDVVISEQTLSAAVKAFQERRGLVNDGLFGVRTLVELNRMIDSQFPVLGSVNI